MRAITVLIIIVSAIILDLFIKHESAFALGCCSATIMFILLEMDKLFPEAWEDLKWLLRKIKIIK